MVAEYACPNEVCGHRPMTTAPDGISWDAEGTRYDEVTR